MSTSTSTNHHHNTRAFQPPPNLKGVFVGSGSDGMNDARICKAVLDLVPLHKRNNNNNNNNNTTHILYLGTATYDLEPFRNRQTQAFLQEHCHIESLDVAHLSPDQGTKNQTIHKTIRAKLAKADVIVVGGGNTLFAVDKWTQWGISPLLNDAMQRGAVLTGGSAGAICWFDGGHSDSMDPDTYQPAMRAKYSHASSHTHETVEESSGAPTKPNQVKDWQYIRVDGLGFLPGLVCPHFDKVQSNGVLRARDFETMLQQRHSGELGIGIDHWAALQVCGDSFRVISLPDQPGSVLADGTFSPSQGGVPGVWILHVSKDGAVQRQLCPPTGKLSELLQHATQIVPDPRVQKTRQANPV